MPFQSFFQIPRRPVELPIYRHLQIPTVNGRAIPLTSRPTVPLPGNFDVSVEKRSNELSEGKKKKKKKNPRRWRSHPRVSCFETSTTSCV